MAEIKVPVEVWSRVVGYFRPLHDWNRGKREEFRERKPVKIKMAHHDKIPSQNN
jgi:anaerobic ribonucleoside-triphosphate reductase